MTRLVTKNNYGFKEPWEDIKHKSNFNGDIDYFASCFKEAGIEFKVRRSLVPKYEVFVFH